MEYSKKIVTAIIVFAVLFTGAILDVFKATGGQEPAVLVGSVFAFLTGELWALAKIKTTKEALRYENQLETETLEPEILGFRGDDGIRRSTYGDK